MVNNSKLYPLKFTPIIKRKVWGGEKIKSIYRHGVTDEANIGESWEIAAMSEEDDSEVINGFLQGNTLSELVEVYMGDLVGDHVYSTFGDSFPLLLKILDAQNQLSIQVHPSADNEELDVCEKNELWYVLQADPEAYVISGFNHEVLEDECLDLLEDGVLEHALRKVPVVKGDVVFVPSGCVHSIGPGCLILEIQQASDTTYRLYDFNRLDTNGQLRQLHIDEALENINWEGWCNDKIDYHVRTNDVTTVLDRPCFTFNIMEIDRPRDYELGLIDSFVILTCVEGHVTIGFDDDYITLTDMESVLIPAEINTLTLVPTVKSRLVETYIK